MAKLMPSKSRLRRTENRVRSRLDLDVADRLQSLRHHRDSGNYRSHRPSRAVERSDCVRQVHEAAAFGVNQAAASREASNGREHRSVRGQFARERLGISAAEVESVHFGQFAISDRREIYNLRAERSQPIQIVFIVKVKRGRRTPRRFGTAAANSNQFWSD